MMNVNCRQGGARMPWAYLRAYASECQDALTPPHVSMNVYKESVHHLFLFFLPTSPFGWGGGEASGSSDPI
jgi:hypothetical protein